MDQGDDLKRNLKIFDFFLCWEWQKVKDVAKFSRVSECDSDGVMVSYIKVRIIKKKI